MQFNYNKDTKKNIKFIILITSLLFFILCIIYRIVMHPSIMFNELKDGVYWIFKILKPFIYGLILAYLCNPLVKWYEKLFYGRDGVLKGKTIKTKQRKQSVIRGICIFLALITFISFIALICYGTYAMIGGSIKNMDTLNLIEKLEATFSQYLNTLGSFDDFLESIGINSDYTSKIYEYLDNITVALQNGFKYIFSLITDIGKIIINLVFSIIFTVNFMFRKEYFKEIYDNMLKLLLKEKRHESFNELVSDINEVFHKFFRCQLLNLTILSIFTSVALFIVGCDFSIMIGVVAGYTNIIPYIGSWGGALPGLIVGFAEGGVGRGLFIYFYILIIQQIYYWTISPKIQGSQMKIHPAFILLSLIVFSGIFGFVGMLLAIPFAGITKIFINRWIKKRSAKLNITIN